MRINESVLKPKITEKSMLLASKNRYVFEVGYDVTKDQVALELKKLFNVDVTEVRSIILPGKKKRQGKTNKFTKGPKRKKVIVSLKEGQKLDILPKE